MHAFVGAEFCTCHGGQDVRIRGASPGLSVASWPPRVALLIMERARHLGHRRAPTIVPRKVAPLSRGSTQSAVNRPS